MGSHYTPPTYYTLKPLQIAPAAVITSPGTVLKKRRLISRKEHMSGLTLLTAPRLIFRWQGPVVSQVASFLNSGLRRIEPGFRLRKLASHALLSHGRNIALAKSIACNVFVGTALKVSIPILLTCVFSIVTETRQAGRKIGAASSLLHS